jgi:surface antigen
MAIRNNHGDPHEGASRPGPATVGGLARRLRTTALLALSVPVLFLIVPPASTSGSGRTASDLGARLTDGATMTAGQYLQSPNGQYTLRMQSDGNLVEYNAAGAPLWDPPPPSGLLGHAGDSAVLQSDGNFVVYPSSGPAPGDALWASFTQGSPGDTLNLQNDGNLVIYSASGAPLWATMSGAVPRGGTDGGNPGFPVGQCTFYAEQKAHQYMGVWPHFTGNADDWVATAERSGWPVGTSPRIGSVIVFQPGTDGAEGDGHVAFVTNYYPSTDRVVISEMNFAGPGRVDTRTITNGTDNPGIKYIYLNP